MPDAAPVMSATRPAWMAGWLSGPMGVLSPSCSEISLVAIGDVLIDETPLEPLVSVRTRELALVDGKLCMMVG